MRSISFTLFLCLLGAVSAAQSRNGKLTGKVFDANGETVAGAPVEIKNSASGTLYKAASSQQGVYTIELPAGSYDISINVGGLKPFQKKGVAVAANQPVNVDVHLEDTTQLSTLGEDRTSILAAATRHHPPSGPTPRTGDGKPDLSGVWWSPTTTDPGQPEFLPWAEELYKKRQEMAGKDSPQAQCLPSPVVRLGPLFQFVQSKDYLIRISDDDSPGFYQIYLDGRPHPVDPNPAWYGHNIGRWEGDTLVVDRVAFHERVWLDREGHPHSDKLHVIERRRPDLGHLEFETTVEDPGALAKPWTQKRVAELAQGEEIYEFICPENNQDVQHMVGK
ncbi:MAG TPA: carboxypeptidase-like regulatory domain-containing protein [Bryobacteraceae bacterium]|nr:carboxypeptidase-like regulatory domain-containing protein [Bryobacteraceae bacterium]